MKTTITIQSIKPPGEGARSGRITTNTGETYWLWATKLGLAKVGATYDIIYEENKGFLNIKTLTQTGASVSEAYRPPANSTPYTPPVEEPASKDEQIFILALVGRFIEAGEVSMDTAEGAINKMRGVYRRTLGRANMQRHMQAAE